VGFLLESFAQMYNTLKTPRKLVWKKQMGMAQLELDLGVGDKKKIDVSLVHATIILHFHGCDVRNLHDLINVTKISEELMRKTVTFWVNHGIIEEVAAGLYSVTSNLQSSNPVTLLNEDIKNANVLGQHDDYAKLYCPYVIGVLTNVGQLPLKRLHDLLRFCMCQGDVKHNTSPQKLSIILEQLCTSRVIEYAYGLYRLPS
jgi:anaphase-promoting complex subunit 2